MKCRSWVLALIVASATLLRLYPYMVAGLPFSTDAWGPIRNTELLIEYSPIKLDNVIMDGYNCYWPANSLFGAIFSQTIGLVPLKAMALIFPIVGSVTIIIFYVMVRRLFSREVSLISSTVFASAFTHAIFTAAVTKETYANPLYLLLILIFLCTIDVERKLFLFTLTSIALVLAHHLTLLVAIMVLSYMAAAHLVCSIKRMQYDSRLDFLLITILAIISFLYYIFYAKAGFKITLTLSDWISVSSYQILALFLATYFTLKPITKKALGFFSLIVLFLSIMLMLLATKESLVSDAPILPAHYLLYATPLIILSPLTVLGSGMVDDIKGESVSAIVFWLSTVLALEGYAVFGNSSIGLTLAYRGINFLWPPLAILCAIGLHRLYRGSRKLYCRRLVIAVTILTITVTTFLNSYTVYASVSLEESYLGYFWHYKVHEFTASEWLKSVYNGQTVVGDVKVSYLLKDYFSIKVDVLQGIKYLVGESFSKPEILFTYHQMYKKGFVLYGGYSFELPKGWREKAYNINLIYSNIYETIYAR